MLSSWVMKEFRLGRTLPVLPSGCFWQSLRRGARSAFDATPPGSLAVVEGEVLDLKADKLDVDIAAGNAVLEGTSAPRSAI